MSRSPRLSALRAAGFTLVELMLVMAITATMMAVAAPMLSRSFRNRHLEQEGLRLLAMTELARNLAISQAVPMQFWVDANGGTYGIQPKPGYEGDASSTRELTLNEDVHFEEVGQGTGASNGVTTLEFAPDGLPESTGLETVRLTDRFGGTLLVARSEDRWNYEIVKEGK